MSEQGEQPRSPRLRRYQLNASTGGGREVAADVERVLDHYGIRDFQYRTWERWTGGLPDGVHAAAREGTMNDAHRHAKAAGTGSIGWEMPEDLKVGVLPILARMQDTSTLVARLKLESGPVVSVAKGRRRDLPDLSELEEDTGLDEHTNPTVARPPLPQRVRQVSPAEEPVRTSVPAAAPAPQTSNSSQDDARTRLRRLALKGQTHG